jgi:tryptophan 2,3-dioxygenase
MTGTARLWTLLDTFNLTEYTYRAHREGRDALRADPALVEQIGALTEACAEVRKDGETLGPFARRAAETAGLFLDAQDYLLTHDKPRYEQYASVGLLRHLLRVEGNTASPAERAHIWLVFRRILEAQLEFELAALAGITELGKRDFSPEVARNRYLVLADIREQVPGRLGGRPVGSRWLTMPAGGRSLCQVARDRSGAAAVERLLLFPQTTCHDEVAFLSQIQLGECLFWGALLCVRQALAALAAGDLSAATRHVRAAGQFARPLIMIFHSVRVMPPAHFLGFREQTGNASAVQCESWQMLDAHLYGVLPEKVAALEATPEVRHVLALARPDFVPLIPAVAGLGDSAAERALRDEIVTLDQRVRAWRAFHTRQLAGRKDPGYLPADARGSGGTSGYPYLAAHRPPRASAMDKGLKINSDHQAPSGDCTIGSR